jgi:hypothetical protein
MIAGKVVMVCQTYLQLYLLSYSCGTSVRINKISIGGDHYVVSMGVRHINSVHYIIWFNILNFISIGLKCIWFNYNILFHGDICIVNSMGP